MDKLCGQQAISDRLYANPRKVSKLLENMKTLPGADINSDHVLLIGEVDIRLKKIRGRQVTKKFDMEKLKNDKEWRKF